MINCWIWILDMNQYIFWIDFWIDSFSFDWCSLEIWICLFDYDYELMVCQSEYTCQQGSVSLCAHRIWTLVGRGSHQPVWTDHPTVRSLMLIAFWFSDELYHMIFLLWPIWETYLSLSLSLSLSIYIYIYHCYIISYVCVLNVIYFVIILVGHFLFNLPNLLFLL